MQCYFLVITQGFMLIITSRGDEARQSGRWSAYDKGERGKGNPAKTGLGGVKHVGSW